MIGIGTFKIVYFGPNRTNVLLNLIQVATQNLPTYHHNPLYWCRPLILNYTTAIFLPNCTSRHSTLMENNMEAICSPNPPPPRTKRSSQDLTFNSPGVPFSLLPPRELQQAKRRRSSPPPIFGAPWYILPPTFVPTPTNITVFACQTGSSCSPSLPGHSYYSPQLTCILSTPSHTSCLYTLTSLRTSSTVTIEHRMGRVYVAQVDMGFGVSVEDIVRQGIKVRLESSLGWLSSNLPSPPLPPSTWIARRSSPPNAQMLPPPPSHLRSPA